MPQPSRAVSEPSRYVWLNASGPEGRCRAVTVASGLIFLRSVLVRRTWLQQNAKVTAGSADLEPPNFL
jgi:hypothetical protein